jgi:hypothetical protein
LVSELKAEIKVSQCNTNHKTPSILLIKLLCSFDFQ